MERRIVVRGYHAAPADKAESIRATGFQSSRNDYDWLGDGAYFFQEAPYFAINWGYQDRKAGQHEELVIFGADIEIDEFVDLFDFRWGKTLRDVYESLDRRDLPDFQKIKERQIEFSFGHEARLGHWLDRFVIEAAVASLDRQGKVVKGVRSAFFEGGILYPKSHLTDRQHIQIAVRDRSAILNYWEETVISREDS